uniref:Peroxidase n=1 Tax=Opuntia streptacantha TaxID=393608 RepID=A0A7C9CG51_OPUST
MYSIAFKPSCSCYYSSNHWLFVPEQNPLQRAVSYISFYGRKPQKRLLCVSCKVLDSQNSFGNFNISIAVNPFSLLIPILQSIRSFTAKAAKCKWGDHLQDPSAGYICCGSRTSILHNGGLGMALLTVKSTAKDRFSPFVATLAANPTFVSGFLAWFLAQSIKVVLNFFVEGKWDLRIWCASGGMPSSHAALCTALTTSVAFCHGVADSLFPVCLGFSLIVMYDAIGVRRHAGMQAEVLNKIIEDLFQGHPISERKLKELLGHTPSQVVAGALLGIIVACLCCQGCLVQI